MALAVDSQQSGGTAFRSTTPGTTSNNFTNAAGDLILVFIVVTCSTGTGTAAISAVTYGGDALTALGTGQTSTVANLGQWWWRRTSVKTGSNALAVTWSSGSTNPAMLYAAITFSGSDSSTPLGTEVKASGSVSPSATGAITSAATSFLVAGVGEGSGTAPTQGTGNTLSASLAGSGLTGGDNIGLEYWDSDGSSRDMQFTFPDDSWFTVGVEVKAAVGGGGPTVALEWKQPNSQPTNHYRPDIVIT